MEIWQSVFIAIVGAWLAASIFVNISLVAMSCKYARMRSNVCMFICNIALADTLLAAYALPQMLHDILHADDYFDGKQIYKIV